jgi:hypothetical protein
MWWLWWSVVQGPPFSLLVNPKVDLPVGGVGVEQLATWCCLGAGVSNLPEHSDGICEIAVLGH